MMMHNLRKILMMIEMMIKVMIFMEMILLEYWTYFFKDIYVFFNYLNALILNTYPWLLSNSRVNL